MPGAATVLAVMLVLGSCTLAGCGAGAGEANPQGLPVSASGTGSAAGPTDGASSSATATVRALPTVTPSPQVKYSPQDPIGEGAWVERGQIIAGSAEKRSAVDVMVKYMALRVRVSNTWIVDDDALAAVASGQAVSSARERAQHEQERGWRAVGRLTMNVSSARIQGAEATISGCYFDGTSELDENGQVVIGPPGGVQITMKLLRTQGVWRVTEWPDHAAPVCTAVRS